MVNTRAEATAVATPPADASIEPLRPDAGRRPFLHLAMLGAILLLGLALRTWSIRAPYGTGDQAAIPNMVRHEYGIGWILGHHYGPVLPLVQRISAEALWRLGRPLTEVEDRLALVVMSLGQIAATWMLLRRLGRSPVECWLAALFCAVLPGLVADAYCPWAYRTPWLLAGTVALWAVLAYRDDRRLWQLALAALALMVHCLSCAYSFALPLAVMGTWGLAWRDYRGRAERNRQGPSIVTAALLGFVLPCVLALGIMGLLWWWTGQGQIGHLLVKRHMGTFGVQWDQVGRLPREWGQQLGPGFGLLGAIGMLAGVTPLLRGQRAGVLALWAWTALLPIVLLTDWDTTGYGANYLLLEPVYAAGLSGVLWACSAWRARRVWRPGLAVVGVVAFAQLLLGSADAIVPGTTPGRYSGIVPGWGRIHPDTGLKAAGWYVRRFVPMEAIVLCLHDSSGLESPVAEYYLGRRVLADYDIRREMIEPLLEATHRETDVVIADAASEGLVSALTGFDRVAVFRNQQQEVRFIHARPALGLARVEAQVQDVNARYDGLYPARRVPQALPAAAGFERHLARYQALVDRLRTERRTAR